MFKLIANLVMVMALMCFGMALVSNSEAGGDVSEKEAMGHKMLESAFIGGFAFCAIMIVFVIAVYTCPSFGKLIFGPDAYVTESLEEGEDTGENGEN